MVATTFIQGILFVSLRLAFSIFLYVVLLYVIFFSYVIDYLVINIYNDLLQIRTLLACGGLAKNPMFVQEHADITGTHCPVSFFLIILA